MREWHRVVAMPIARALFAREVQDTHGVLRGIWMASIGVTNRDGN